MEPPSLRELQLETLLREREAQLAELTDEITLLRRYLTNQPAPSRTDSISLPPALLALLQPYVNSQPTQSASGSGSTTMTAALVQRTRVLQEENDELYGLLRVSSTGQLKEEVRYLRKTVSRLERALKESDATITTLSDELDKTCTSFLAQQKINDVNRRDFRSTPSVPPLSVHPESSENSNSGDLKPIIPTGPRAHKKPRLSESQPSPALSTVNLPLSNSNSTPLGNTNRSSRRDRSPRVGDERRSPLKEARMDGDEDVKQRRDRSRDRPREKERESHRDREEVRQRDRERERDHERDRARDHRPRDRDRDREAERHREKDKGDKEKERERERERDRSRRNGRGSGGGGGGGGGGRKGGRGSSAQEDRTLRQRMGL